MSDIGIISPDCLDSAWPDVAEIIRDKGEELLKTHSPQELFANVLARNYDLWAVTEGDELKLVGFCGWEEHAFKKNYHVVWVGGSGIKLLKKAVAKVEQYACLHGASELTFCGRFGWDRVLKPLGFVPQGRWSKNVETCWKH